MNATTTRVRPLLFERFPALEGKLAWLPFATGAPTPIEPLLAPGLGVERLYVKRDDRTSPVYGGNKVRKLEWILAEAKRAGRRSVITAGACGSHHCLATALFAREAGLRATLVLYPQPRTAHVDEILAADRAAGARIVEAKSVAGVAVATAHAYTACFLSGDGMPYKVALGGSDALGTLGYVECGLEIAAAVERGEAPAPDFVYAAAGTCGTIAGLALGLGIAGLGAAVRVVGVRVVPSFIATPGRTRRLVKAAARRLGVDPRGAAEVEILGDQLGRGYGHETPAALAARDAALAAGLETETTYTAKALAGLKDYAAGPNRRRRIHLYIHTLGHLPPRAS